MRNFTSIFNPLNKDITVNWDLTGRNPKTWVLKSKEITKVDTKYVNHVKKTLLDAVFDAKGDYRKRRDIQIEEFEKEIEV